MCKLGLYNNNEGQIDCKKCQSYHSTRKLGAKSLEECIGLFQSLYCKKIITFHFDKLKI